MNNVAYLYGRVSDRPDDKKGAADDDPDSIKTQFALCRKYCELKSLCAAAEYPEAWVSGKSTTNRPELEKCLNVVCAQSATLVVYSLSRLARSTKDALAIVERLRAAGANLVSVKENIDTQTAMGQFIFTVFAALAQLEREQIGERTSDSMLRRQADGEIMGSRLPFGFKRSADPKRMEPCKYERGLARLIKNFKKQGLNHRQVIGYLNRLGFTWRGGRFHPSLISDALAWK